jgi:hypothetical protein
MIDALAIALMVAVIVGLGVASINSLIRRPALGAGLVLGATVINAALIRIPRVMAPGGVAVELSDVIFALLLGAAIARLLVMRLTMLQHCLLLLSLLVVLSLVRGVAAFGIQPSIAEFRLYMYFLSGALYFTSFPASASLNHRIGNIWVTMSLLMALIAGVRWLAIFTGIDLGLPAERFGADSAIRVMDGPYAFFLANSAVLTVSVWRVRDEHARRWRVCGAVAMLTVVILDRRTIWLALFVGIAIIILRNPGFRRRALVIIAATVGIVSVLFTFSRVSSDAKHPFAQSPLNTANFNWRVEGWEKLVGSWSEDPAHWLVGEPFGNGYARTIGRAKETSHPHNFYIATLMRTGVAGLLALIAITLGVLRAVWRMGKRGGLLLAPLVFPALLTMQMIWFFTWVPGIDQGIITGLALALAATRGRGWRELSQPESFRAPRPGPDGLSPVRAR